MTKEVTLTEQAKQLETSIRQEFPNYHSDSRLFFIGLANVINAYNKSMVNDYTSAGLEFTGNLRDMSLATLKHLAGIFKHEQNFSSWIGMNDALECIFREFYYTCIEPTAFDKEISSIISSINSLTLKYGMLETLHPQFIAAITSLEEAKEERAEVIASINSQNIAL